MITYTRILDNIVATKENLGKLVFLFYYNIHFMCFIISITLHHTVYFTNKVMSTIMTLSCPSSIPFIFIVINIGELAVSGM